MVDMKPNGSIINGRHAVEACDMNMYYGSFRAVKNLELKFERNKITALIGPSGCGKSTVLRAINRMNELIPSYHATGEMVFDGINIYEHDIDPVEVRRHVGMVFQTPNPFPKSIYDNIAWGPRKINKVKGNLDELVEDCLRQAALWEEVKDKLHESGLSLSGGQQQRLCIARAIALKPRIILMDEPTSALDPIATIRIEELLRDLAQKYTIIIVTHNMQQAGRVSDYTAFFSIDPDDMAGNLVEYSPTEQMFLNPRERKTQDYISGRFG